MDIAKVLSEVNSFVWGPYMLFFLVGTGVFLTVRLKFLPWRNLWYAIGLITKKEKSSEGDITPFQSLMTALSATVGTGNIVGVATAIVLGGPGALVWMWISAAFGLSTKYAESVLAVKYRVKKDNGKVYGGPMYALERGLGWKKMAVLFSVFTAVAAFGIGNTVQANAIATLTHETYSVSPTVSGAVIALMAGLVILGGIKSIARVCEMLVPFMAFFYVIGCIVILIMNGEYVWPALKLICESAFTPEAAGGGFVGTTVMMAARFGIARGLFSNESGMGSAPIVASAAKTRNPVRQALVSSSGTFWDTVVICALTGLVIVSSVIAYPDISYDNGATLTKLAFSKIPYIGSPLLTFGLLTFAFSTILGWELYGERAIEYLKGGRWTICYRIVYIIFIFIGAVMNLGIVWNIADCMNALMAIPNLLCLLFLSNVIVKETREYLWNKQLDKDMEEDFS